MRKENEHRLEACATNTKILQMGPGASGTGFQPVQSFQVTRRNLPHWQESGGEIGGTSKEIQS
jgi:hypothetical protein